MNRTDVIAELEYYREMHKTLGERMERMIKSLRGGATAAAEPEPPPRDGQGYAPAPEPRPQTNGEFLELDMESLDVTDDGRRKTFKVKGGAYRKWGVFIWPEVLEREFGINSETIAPGLHPFKFRVRILMDGDKPKKVVGIVQ